MNGRAGVGLSVSVHVAASGETLRRGSMSLDLARLALCCAGMRSLTLRDGLFVGGGMESQSELAESEP